MDEGLIMTGRAGTAPVADGVPAEADLLLDLSERVWEGGGPILYQPEAALVRAFSTAAEGDEDHESHPRSDASGGEDAQLARPERPDPLDEEAWRMVIAQDDVLGART